VKIEDYKNEYGEWMQTGTVAGKNYFTVGGVYWQNMTQRCKVGGDYQRKQPTYLGCSHTWTSCHEFIEWARKQVGYGSGALDKDILLKGNKVYCPELCVFVPQVVNNLLTKSNATRGEWPVGVYLHKKTGKFAAQVNADGKRKYLGLFNTSEAALAVYKPAKEAEIKRVAALYRYVLDPRVYDALMTYNVDAND